GLPSDTQSRGDPPLPREERTWGRRCALEGKRVLTASSAPNDRLARLMEEAGFDSHKAFARAVLEESRHAGDPLRRCDHTYVLRWLHGMVPRGKTPVFIASVLSRALRRPVTMADLGMPLAGHLSTLDVGMAYPDSLTAAIDNVSLLW